MTAPEPAPAFKRALVTGATGFVGSHLARRLVAAGVETTILARSTSDLAPLREAASSVTVLRATGNDDSVRAAVASAETEVVFHLAASYVAAHRPEDIPRLIGDNVALTALVCEGAKDAGSRALVHSGTAAQHAGSPPGDTTPTPNTLYAATKQAADDIVGYYAHDAAASFAAATLKIYDTYGPNDPRGRFLDQVARAVKENRRLAVSPGEQHVHLVHVDDVAAGFVHAANLLLAGTLSGHASFTLPSAAGISLRALVDAWSQATGLAAPVDWGARPYRDGEIMRPWEGTALPGWSARITLEDGLRQVYGG